MSKEAKPWFNITAKAAEDESVAEVRIYDEIGESWWGGTSAKAFAQQISDLDVDTIRLYLNSPGGAAWDGITIMNALRRHRARVEVTVDGLAASAASVIAMAGDSLTMALGSSMMIHDASGGAWGPAETMEEVAEILHKLSDSIADIYAARGGRDRAYWRELMRAETWYTAEEAVDAGLADSFERSGAEPVEDPRAAFNMSMFARAGRPVLAAARAVTLPASEPGSTRKKEEAMAYGDLTAGLRERLGVTDADASDEVLLAALDEALAEQAEPSPAIPEGAQLIDSGVLAQLQADAQAGREARDQIDAQRRDGIVARAVEDGRIAPAARDSWRKQLDADEKGTAALLESLAVNKIPVTEIGHSDDVQSAEDALYAKAFGSSEEV